jgi:hypothetical protein
MVTRDQRHTGFLHQGFCSTFEAHGGNGGGGWSDKVNAFPFAGLCQLRVFRQETVAGMDGVSTGLAGRVEDLVHPQITLAGCSRANRE